MPSPSELDAIIDEAVKKFQVDSDGRRTCLITDRTYWGSEITTLSLDSPVFPWRGMQAVLQTPPDVTNGVLRLYYDLSAVDARFAGLILSPRGLGLGTNGRRVASFSMCE